MPQSGNRAAWPSSDDMTAISLAVICMALVFFGWLAWLHFHAEIASVALVIAHWEIVLIHQGTSTLDPLDASLQTVDPATLTFTEVCRVLNAAGLYLRIPAIILIVLLAVPCLLRAAPSRFTRALDLDGLIAEQAKTFRSTAAFVGRNLELVPLDAIALRPADPALHVAEWTACFATSPEGEFDGQAARRKLAAQLGMQWVGEAASAPAARFMFAVGALHLAQRRTDAQALLGLFAESMPRGGARETAGPAQAYPVAQTVQEKVADILRDDALRTPAEAIARRHAFTAPALMSLLTEARRRAGVLAPGQFAGLKLVDRSLWYALHSLGFEGDGPGQTSHPNPRVEAAGARDHWTAERLLGRPIGTPNIERALDAIRVALGHDKPTSKPTRAA